MSKESDAQLHTIIKQQLSLPVFQPYTLSAGLLVYGWTSCSELLIKNNDNIQLSKLVRLAAYSTFVITLPRIEVGEEMFKRLVDTHQVIDISAVIL